MDLINALWKVNFVLKFMRSLFKGGKYKCWKGRGMFHFVHKGDE